jgi:type I restriction enzyme S subunit
MVGDALLSRADAPVICASFCRLVRADQNQLLPELLRFHFDHIYATREIMQYQTQSTGITNFKFMVFLEKEMVLKPPVDVQAQFSEVARPMLQLAESLGIKNSVLRATRDLLLPKLISGDLDVSAVADPEALAA